MQKPEIFNYSKEDKKIIADAIRKLADDIDYLDWYILSENQKEAIEFLLKSDIAIRDRAKFYRHYADLLDFYEIEPEYEIISHLNPSSTLWHLYRYESGFEYVNKKSKGFILRRNRNEIRKYYKNWKIDSSTDISFIYPTICPEMRQLIVKEGGKFPSTLSEYYYTRFPFDKNGRKIENEFEFFCKVSGYTKDLTFYTCHSWDDRIGKEVDDSENFWSLYYIIMGGGSESSGNTIADYKIKKIFSYIYKLLDLIYFGTHEINFNWSNTIYDFYHMARFLAESDDTIVENIFRQFYILKEITGHDVFYGPYFDSDDEWMKKYNNSFGYENNMFSFLKIVVNHYNELYIDPIEIKERLKNKTVNNLCCAIVELYYRPVNFPRILWNLPFEIYFHGSDTRNNNLCVFDESFCVHLLTGKKLETFKGTAEIPIEFTPQIAKRMSAYLMTGKTTSFNSITYIINYIDGNDIYISEAISNYVSLSLEEDELTVSRFSFIESLRKGLDQKIF